MERRTHPRAALDIHLRLVFADELVHARAVDLSEGGMQFASGRVVSQGTRMTLEFSLPGQKVGHSVVGIVVWCWRHPTHEARYLHGVRFVNPSFVTRAGIKVLLKQIAGTNMDAALDESIAAQTSGGAAPSTEEIEIDFAEDVPSVGEAPARGAEDAGVLPGPTGTSVAKPVTATGGPEVWQAELQAVVEAENRNRKAQQTEAKALQEQARTLMRDDNHQAAVELLERAFQISPDSADVAEDLAHAYYAMGEILTAAELLDLAMRLKLESK